MIDETKRAEIRRFFNIEYGPVRAGTKYRLIELFDTSKEALHFFYLIAKLVQTCIVEPFIFELWDENGVRYFQGTVNPLHRSIQLKRRRRK